MKIGSRPGGSQPGGENFSHPPSKCQPIEISAAKT